MGFDKDAAKKTAGLSEFIIRLLQDVWPVRQHQSVALKSEISWRGCNAEMLSGEIKDAEPSVFMPLKGFISIQFLTFLGFAPPKGVDGQKAPKLSASFWCSPLFCWILKFLLKCHLQGDHQVCWRNVHWDWQDLGIESWHMAFCPNFILHIFVSHIVHKIC